MLFNVSRNIYDEAPVYFMGQSSVSRLPNIDTTLSTTGQTQSSMNSAGYPFRISEER